jgi:Rieske Fe-S protein
VLDGPPPKPLNQYTHEVDADGNLLIVFKEG